MLRPTTSPAWMLLILSDAGLMRITLASASQIQSPSEEESMMVSSSRVSSLKKAVCFAISSSSVLSTKTQTAPSCSWSKSIGLTRTR